MADVRTIQKAFALLREEGIRGVLVGTAALQLHGYDVAAPDIDFLVEHKPRAAAEHEDRGYDAEVPFTIDGTKVDYVVHDAPVPMDAAWRRDTFFHPDEAGLIVGVPVAPLRDVVGLKFWRGRPKDHATLFALGLHPSQHIYG